MCRARGLCADGRDGHEGAFGMAKQVAGRGDERRRFGLGDTDQDVIKDVKIFAIRFDGAKSTGCAIYPL